MIKSKKQNFAIALIIFIALLSIGVLLMLAPIAQDPSYHAFSDTDSWLSIPNTLNVLSNLPFLIVGLWGINGLFNHNSLKILQENRLAYSTLFFGIALVSLGSGYYHLNPNNQTLVWDRLPMTMAFMSLFSIILSEFISTKLGKLMLAPLLFLGIFSVVYWHYTQISGAGDLRLYAFIQFFPISIIPIILVLFPPAFSGTSAYWWLLASYLLAKLFEHFDRQIHETLVYISGHSIKHILAAIGIYILIKSYRTRLATK